MITVKVLATGLYKVVAMKKGNRCPAEDFLYSGGANTKASRVALLQLIDRVSENGLEVLPSALCHLVDQPRGIYEFRKGQLRLFFFKGTNGDVAVCTGGVLKKTQKVDSAAVELAAKMQKSYLDNARHITYEED